MTGDACTTPLRVVLVEDSPRIAALLREILETDALAEVVSIAEDEQGAIDATRKHIPDVLILDLQLRIGTGFDVLRALGETRPIVIIMTNYALPQYRARASSFAVEYFLDKSLEFDQLPGIITEISRRIHGCANSAGR